MRDNDRRTAPAERVHDNVTFIATGLNDPFKQCFRLLGRIPETFGGL